ncbi:unnamed protein product [Brassica oleracea var. botrytis]
MTGSVRIVDEDLFFLRHVEALEAAYACNSGTTKPVYEKSTDNPKSGEYVEVGSVVIPGSDSLPHQTCNERDKGMSSGDDMVSDMGKSKEDNACVACVDVVEEKGNSKEADTEETCQQIVVDRGKSKGKGTEAGFEAMEVDKEKGKGDDIGEDEGDDFEYDFNWWHDYVRNDCMTDDDKDDDGGLVAGGSGRGMLSLGATVLE